MNATDKEKYQNAMEQGKAQFESIKEMLETLKNAEEAENEEETESARETIEQDALSLQYRSGWTNPGEEMKPEEYELLLCTGGPACRIVGMINEYGEPETAKLEVQDWFLPWTEYREAEEDVLLDYARHYVFSC